MCNARGEEQNMMLVLAKTSAEEKLGNFLIRLSHRFKRLGFSATQFRLTMSGNHVLAGMMDYTLVVLA
jgi:CRP/FNR family transcriptional regulator